MASVSDSIDRDAGRVGITCLCHLSPPEIHSLFVILVPMTMENAADLFADGFFAGTPVNWPTLDRYPVEPQ